MTAFIDRTLHWKQRVALIRHNLHMASLNHDFGFFRALQAYALVTKKDNIAALSDVLESNDGKADHIILNMEKFNAVIACVHEDAFKNVYGSILACVGDRTSTYRERRAMFREDMVQQKSMADESINKMLDLAVDIIQEQPLTCRDAATDVLISGSTFAAEAMDICLTQMEQLESKLDDRGLLTQAWANVESGVGAAISAMRVFFNLMALSENQAEQQPKHARSQSVDNFARIMLRRVSNVLSSSSSSTSPPPDSSCNASVGSWTPSPSRDNSTSSDQPTHTFPGTSFLNFQLPSRATNSGHVTTALSPICGTPTGMQETLNNPLEGNMSGKQKASR